MRRFLPSIGIFLLGVLIIAVVVMKFAEIILLGMVLALFCFVYAVLLLLAAEGILKRSKRGEITSKGIKWEIREEPVRVVLPHNPTNTTDSEKAKKLCEEGRQCVSQKKAGQDVDLDKALSLFERASELDEDFWEAQLNVAALKLLQGNTKDALAIASHLRTRFADVPLAFVKSTLIIAKIEELLISKNDPQASQQGAYKKLARLLEESLDKQTDHLTTRISLGRVYLLAGETKDTLEKFLTESLKDDNFAEAFRKALEAEGLTREFEDEHPELYKLLKQEGNQ